ncbi:response regulator [Hymenobacter sp. BT664]|uniref:Response regulator n=1 Tax=Hymenobacter montanus TaxID=2771359 RepID=A0A927BFY8_9BACT|nr:response regulator [Hymenobacter montanus]MBD2769353.1 response regulator [Hymenobacter montanus]
MDSLRCILLVDDDPTLRFLNRRLLARLGPAQHVLEAANGQEALAIIHAQRADDIRTRPDLILLDVHMPVMDGFAFLAAYRALPEQQQCAKVVAMLTSSRQPHDLERAIWLSASAYLIKPFTANQFHELVHDYFTVAPARD